MSMKRPAKNPTTVSTPMVGAPTMEQLMAIGIDESMAHSMIQTAEKKLAVDLDSARVEFEKSSGLSAKMDELIKLQTEINDLKSTRPELYTKSGGRTRKEKCSALDSKNLYCKHGDGKLVDGHHQRSSKGCKYVCRNQETLNKHYKEKCKFE